LKKGNTYFIGDIHGCARTFTELLFEVIGVRRSDRIFLLGDYIDRGPDSAAVIDIILTMIKKEYTIFPLMGNHELMLLQSLRDPVFAAQWTLNGGRAAMDSWKTNDPTKIPAHHIDFIKGLKYYFKVGDFIAVHAGLNFSVEKPLEDTESMLWIRNDSVDRTKIKGRKLIVGHTPTTLEDIKKSLNSDRIRLDGGCVYSARRPEYGLLCALRLEGMRLFTQKNIDF